jgi:transposase
MQIELKVPHVWLACESVDFRKAANGLSEIVARPSKRTLDNHMFIFFNRAKTTVKILGYHRGGVVLIYKRLDLGKFAVKTEGDSLCGLNEQALSWLLAGLDWIKMSERPELAYTDFC